MSRTPIAAPVPQGPAYSLEQLVPVLDDQGVRWQDGTDWLPEACAGGGRSAVRGCAMNLAEAWSAAVNPGTAVADPFVVWHVEECSTFPQGDRDMIARATRGLTTSRSFWIAEALWDGFDDEGVGAEQEQRSLADVAADTVTNGGEDVVTAVSCLDASLARAGRGRRGLLHLTPEVLDAAVAAQVVWRNGQAWMTGMGNLVVADAGYTGTGPNGEAAGDTQWGYGTSPLRLRLSTIVTVPGSLDTDEGRATAMVLDESGDFDNSIRVVAWQAAMFEWDACVHVAAEFAVPVCLVGGTS